MTRHSAIIADLTRRPSGTDRRFPTQVKSMALFAAAILALGISHAHVADLHWVGKGLATWAYLA